MCGIVGYLGKQSVVPVIIESLRTLEYRGYDSAGIAFLGESDSFHIYKSAGKLLNLEALLDANQDKQPLANGKNHIGIGHIRWATHGAANDTNAHPHLGADQEIAVVHNGIIENFAEIKRNLQAQGRTFVSETDSECIAQLMESLFNQAQEQSVESFRQVIREALKIMKGAYALSIINRRFPDRIFAVRNHAPLVVGHIEVANGQKPEFVVASDAIAVVPYTNKIVYLKDREIVELSAAEGMSLTDLDGQPVDYHVEEVNMGPLQIDKKGFKHFMLKEIHEQPDVVRNSLSGRLCGADEPIRLLPMEAPDSPAVQTLSTMLKTTKRIVVVGCGTSFNAGLVGKYFIEELVRLPVDVESAGEYRYRHQIIDQDTLVVAISQSGETADTLEATRQAMLHGAKILTITNREDSSLARESHVVLPVRAGVEISVCATKSFTAQVVVLYLLGLALAEVKGQCNTAVIHELKSGLLKIPTAIEAVLSNVDHIHTVAKVYSHFANMFFIARGINYPVAMEGALKLKEISYIHAEAYSGSELKHGPIAMLDENMPVVAVLTPGIVFEKLISNCQEAKARDAKLIGFSTVPLDDATANTFDDFYHMDDVENVMELLTPLVTTVPLQLFAYYVAEHLGKDVDQPRNLAKSVTVE